MDKHFKLLRHLCNLNLDEIDNNNGYKINPYIAYKNKKPVSMCVVLNNGQQAYITRVCKLPEYREQHIASNLIKYAIKNEDCDKCFLCTNANDKVKGFYNKIGFKIIANGKCLVKKQSN